jgi:hypothetical protein
MRGLFRVAVAGTVVLLAGCRTDQTVATRRGRGSDGLIAQNPSFGPRGFSLTGIVQAEYSDMLVLEDRWGKIRHLRIREDTLYYQDGKLIGREFLAPGSSVRASYSHGDAEMIAREIVVLEDAGDADPLQLQDRKNTIP